jgi:VanZ family protein
MSDRAIAIELPSKPGFIEWLPVVMWAAVMFVFSTSFFTAAETLRIIGPLLTWLFPAISPTSIAVANLLIRKAAHFTEYAILFWLLAHGPLRHHPYLALATCVAYALFDEGHQILVPGRTASLYDVALDSTGATFSGFLQAAIAEMV